jgi:hypothetical protein
MPRSNVASRVMVGVATVGIIGFSLRATVALVQVSIRPGVGAGYTAAPGYAGESPGGDWNGEAFILLGLGGIPLELRPTVFTYGRGTGARLGVLDCPCVSSGCTGGCGPGYYIDGSGRERATGGMLDATFRLSSGLLAPYLIGGLGVVDVSRQAAPHGTTVHRVGTGYEFGGGARLAVGPLMVFGEAKFFGTDASADQFAGHSVHMIPLTVGIAF